MTAMSSIEGFNRDTSKRIIDSVTQLFSYDLNKVVHWFITPVQLLENATPLGLVQAGREVELLKFIETQTKENSML
jgi:hypothetical protein